MRLCGIVAPDRGIAPTHMIVFENFQTVDLQMATANSYRGYRGLKAGGKHETLQQAIPHQHQ